IKGFNQNWAFVPSLDTAGMTGKFRQLRPQMLRFPGGTLSHGWDWRLGKTTRRVSSNVHFLPDVKRMADATGAQFTIVLDIIFGRLDDQIAMLTELQRLGVAITHIELGNEIYAQDDEYIARFPTGAEYGREVNLWTAALKNSFPNAKVAAVLFAREVGGQNARGQNWNRDVLALVTAPIDAWTMHIYIPVGGTALARMADFDAILAQTNLGNRALWITEYGNQNEETDPNYLPELLALTDAIEAHPAVSIALNHLVVGNNKNKITSDGMTFTAEGNAFLARVGG
ncbi:MAG: hypothetical protein ABL909_09285, partial [Sphingopyxis sp.]